MAIWDAFKKLESVLNAHKPTTKTGITWPSIVRGVPENAAQKVHPAWYLSYPRENRQYQALKQVKPTSVRASSNLYLVIHKDEMPSTVTDFDEYLYDTLAKAIISAIEGAVNDGSFASDGASGSTIIVADWSGDWRPGESLGYLKFILEIAQYS
jgi:hypothetical protein